MTPGGIENLVFAAVLFAVIGLAVFAYLRWAYKDTSHMTPEEAVNHREKVITVDKGIDVTNVVLGVANQAVKHAGPGPAKKATFSDVAIPALGLVGYALSRHAERHLDVADGVDPDLPPDRVHAARVAAETARRATTSP